MFLVLHKKKNFEILIPLWTVGFANMHNLETCNEFSEDELKSWSLNIHAL